MADDKYIIKQIRKGDVAAFAVLVSRYRHMVYTLALQLLKNKEEAEEVAQDTFLKVFRALDRFEGRSAFSTWVYRIAYHQSISQLRKRHNKETGYDDGREKLINVMDNSESGTDILEAEDRSRYLKAALSKIKGEEAAVLTLFYFEELKTDQISEITGMSISNVKIRLYRGRQNLLKELKGVLKKDTDSLL